MNEVTSNLNGVSSVYFESISTLMSSILGIMTIVISILIIANVFRAITSCDEYEKSRAFIGLITAVLMVGILLIARTFFLPMMDETLSNMKTTVENVTTTNSIDSNTSSIEDITIENTLSVQNKFTEEELKQQEKEKKEQQFVIEIEKEKIREQERIKEEKRKEFIENIRDMLPTIGIIILIFIIIASVIYVLVDNWLTIFNFFRKTKVYKLINKDDYDNYQLEIKTKELQGYIDKLVELKNEIEKSCKGDISKASLEYQYSYEELIERIQNLEEQLVWLPTHAKLHRLVEEDIEILEKSKEGKSHKSVDILNSYIDLVDKTDNEIEILKAKYDKK